MATKSMLKTIDIKDKNLGKSFVVALENAEEKVSKKVYLKKSVKKINRGKIKDFLGE